MNSLNCVFLYFFLLFSHSLLLAQEKADYNWILGYNSSTTVEYDSFNIYGNSLIDFNIFSDIAFRVENGLDMDYANTSISDDNGNLLFYTNGVEIGAKNHEIMENSEYLYDNSGGWPLRTGQGALILPYPEQTNKYTLIHCTPKFVQVGDVSTLMTYPLYYSIIDMGLNDGLGVVTEKQLVLNQDSLQLGKLTACRHANGRDWWILIPKFYSSKIKKYLLTPNGFIEKETQVLSDTILNGPGQAVFSPDGSVFAYLSIFEIGTSDIQVFNFDRCTGELSPLYRYTEPDYGTLSGGLAISPNSRFLYHTSLYEAYQFDLWADDIGGSKDTIAVHDGYEEPIPGTNISLRPLFLTSQLAPNGKIYVRSSNSVRALHIIHNPNEKGLACNFEQRAMMLPNLNYSMPTFPNYRLGALEGSSCDTITAVGNTPLPPKLNIAMWPNPAREQLNLKIEGFTAPSNEKIDIIIRDALGQEVKRHRQINSINDNGSFILKIRLDLPAGIYFCEGRFEGNAIFLRKFVVI